MEDLGSLVESAWAGTVAVDKDCALLAANMCFAVVDKTLEVAIEDDVRREAVLSALG